MTAYLGRPTGSNVHWVWNGSQWGLQAYGGGGGGSGAVTSSITYTELFPYTATTASFVVPANVTSINVKMWGPGGGSGGYPSNNTAGAGGFTSGTISVTPGEQLLIIVGGGGQGVTGSGGDGGLGGYGNGGFGTKGDASGGGGGGYTGIFTGSIEQINAIMIAGGGGAGTGYKTGGGGGGTTGGTGNAGAGAGTGGTQTAAGTPSAGGRLFGGKGTGQRTVSTGDDDGGGGSGYWGGGGGSGDGAGGGGGSAFIHATRVTLSGTAAGSNGNTSNTRAAPPMNTDTDYLTIISQSAPPPYGVGTGGNAAGSNGTDGGHGFVLIRYTIGQNIANWYEDDPNTAFITSSIAVGITSSAQTMGTDNFVYVSGTIGLSGASAKKAVFGGDVKISGSLSVGTGSVLVTSNDIQFSSFGTRIEKQGSDLKFFDSNNSAGKTLTELAQGGGGGTVSSSIGPRFTRVMNNVTANGSSPSTPVTNWTASYAPLSQNNINVFFIVATGFNTAVGYATLKFKIDGEVVASSSIYFNETEHHTFPTILYSTQLTTASHALRLEISGNNGIADANDWACLDVIEFSGSGGSTTTIITSSVTSSWMTVYDRDLSLFASQSFAVTGSGPSPVVMDGYTWYLENQSNAQAVGILPGTGLVFNLNSNTSDYEGATRTLPMLTTRVSDRYPAYSILTDDVRLWVRLEITGATNGGNNAVWGFEKFPPYNNSRRWNFQVLKGLNSSLSWYAKNRFGASQENIGGSGVAYNTGHDVVVIRKRGNRINEIWTGFYNSASNDWPTENQLQCLTVNHSQQASAWINDDGQLTSSVDVGVFLGCQAGGVGTANFKATFKKIRIDVKSENTSSVINVISTAATSSVRVGYHDLTHSPIGLWQFSGTINDSTSYSHNLTCSAGNTRFTGMGPGLKGVAFDGSTMLTLTASLPTAVAALLTGAMTFQTLINIEPQAAANNIISITGLTGDVNGSENNLFNLVVNTNGTLAYGAEFDVGTNVGFTTQDMLPLNRLFHLAVSRNSSGVIKTYIDGALFSTSSTTTMPNTGTVALSSARINFGAFPGSDFSTATGPISNTAVASAKIVTRELTADEISAEYGRTLGQLYATLTTTLPITGTWRDAGNSFVATGSVSIDSQNRTVSQLGADVYLFVSGTIGVSTASNPGNARVALFGGDVRISGSLTVGTGSVKVTSNDVQFGSFATRIQKSGNDLVFFDGNNTAGRTLASFGSGGSSGGSSVVSSTLDYLTSSLTTTTSLTSPSYTTLAAITCSFQNVAVWAKASGIAGGANTIWSKIQVDGVDIPNLATFTETTNNGAGFGLSLEGRVTNLSTGSHIFAFMARHGGANTPTINIPGSFPPHEGATLIVLNLTASGNSTSQQNASLAVYDGYCTGSLSWTSTTWADFTTIPGNFTDLVSIGGIARSGSTWTVTQTGYYQWHSFFNSVGTNEYIAWRLSGSNGTIIQQTSYANSNDQQPGILNGTIQLNSGSSFKLQYVVKQGTPGNFAVSDPIDGENMVTGRISMFLLGSSQNPWVDTGNRLVTTSSVVVSGAFTPAGNYGTYSQRGLPGNAGRRFTTTDCIMNEWIDDGVAWRPFVVGVIGVEPPLTGTLDQNINVGSNQLIQYSGSFALIGTNDAGNSFTRGYTKSFSSTTAYVECLMMPLPDPIGTNNFPGTFLGMRESSSGKIYTFGTFMHGTNYYTYAESGVWASPTSRTTSAAWPIPPGTDTVYYRIRRDAANVYAETSRNRKVWIVQESRALTSVFTTAPDEIGVFTLGFNSVPRAYFLHFASGST